MAEPQRKYRHRFLEETWVINKKESDYPGLPSRWGRGEEGKKVFLFVWLGVQ